MRKVGSILVAAMATFALAGAAIAQPANNAARNAVGEVTAIDGPVGSVLIVRGNQTYSLQVGDKLFAGDQVWTRTNGKAAIKYYTCTANLDTAESVTVAPNCAAALQLPTDGSVGNVAVAAAGTAGEAVGTIPALLSLAVVTAGVVAIADDSSD